MPTGYGKIIKNGINFSHDAAASISYDNSSSGLNSTDVQAAINELKNKIPTDFVSKANGGTFGGSITINGITKINGNYLQVDTKDGTTASIGSSRLLLGNNIAQGNDGNSSGRLVLYGPSTAWADIKAENVTSKTQLQMPNGKSGTIAVAEDIPTDFVSKANGGTFNNSIGVSKSVIVGNPTVSSASVTGCIYTSNDIYSEDNIHAESHAGGSTMVALYANAYGTSAKAGEGRLGLGNRIKVGEDGNSYGRIRINGRGTKCTDILTNNNGEINDNILYLPVIPNPEGSTATLTGTLALNDEFVSKASGGTFNGQVGVNTNISDINTGDLTIFNKTRTGNDDPSASQWISARSSIIALGGKLGQGIGSSVGELKLYTYNGGFITIKPNPDSTNDAGFLYLPQDQPGAIIATKNDMEYAEERVIQKYSNSDKSYRLLMSPSDNNDEEIRGTYKSHLAYNPSLRVLLIGRNAGTTPSTNWAGASINATQAEELIIGADYNQPYSKVIIHVQNMWAFSPWQNGGMTLGDPGKKWADIYSNNSSISSSDRNLKKDIEDLNTFAKDFIMDLKPVSYKMIDGKSGRTHYGLIAQDVEDTLIKYNKTGIDFAGLCKYNKVDESGEQIKDEYEYALRYGEFIAPIIKTVQLQEEKINSLEDRINKLESIIKQLTEK